MICKYVWCVAEVTNMAKPKKQTVGVNLELPPELHTALKVEAARARKTMSAFIVEALRSATKSARAA